MKEDIADEDVEAYYQSYFDYKATNLAISRNGSSSSSSSSSSGGGGNIYDNKIKTVYRSSSYEYEVPTRRSTRGKVDDVDLISLELIEKPHRRTPAKGKSESSSGAGLSFSNSRGDGLLMDTDSTGTIALSTNESSNIDTISNESSNIDTISIVEGTISELSAAVTSVDDDDKDNDDADENENDDDDDDKDNDDNDDDASRGRGRGVGGQKCSVDVVTTPAETMAIDMITGNAEDTDIMDQSQQVSGGATTTATNTVFATPYGKSSSSSGGSSGGNVHVPSTSSTTANLADHTGIPTDVSTAHAHTHISLCRSAASEYNDSDPHFRDKVSVDDFPIMVAHEAAVERARQGAAAGQIEQITELLVNKTDQSTVINLVEHMTDLNQHVKSFLTHLDWDFLLNDICKKHKK